MYVHCENDTLFEVQKSDRYPCQGEDECPDELPICPKGYYYKLNISKCHCYECLPCPPCNGNKLPDLCESC